MAGRRQSSKKENDVKRIEVLENPTLEVENVRLVTFKGKRGHKDEEKVFFTLVVNGVKIYNVSIAEGKDGEFLSMPSKYDEKTKKYYNYAYAPLCVEDTEAVIEMVDKALEEVDE